jgi:hypothetical protein
MSWAVIITILLLILVAVLGRAVPAWHDAIVNFFSFLSYIFTGTGITITGTPVGTG